MTVQTAAQRNQSYRARRKAKLERLAVLEDGMREIMDLVDCAFDGTLASPITLDAISDIARKALGNVG